MKLDQAIRELPAAEGARRDDWSKRWGKGTDWSGSVLSDCNLNRLCFAGHILTNTKLIRCSFRNANFSGSKLDKADFSHSDLHGADLSAATARHAKFHGANMSSLRAGNAADFSNAILTDTNLAGARLSGSNLEHADLSGATLYRTSMASCKLANCKLPGARVDAQTNLSTLQSVEGCTIDRHALESLENYGGLTPGQRMRMNIIDGVATLRAEYSGFWMWFHVIALFLFMYPYIWFVVMQWARARFLPGLHDDWIPLWLALSRYIVNGGEGWQQGFSVNFLSCLAFLYALVYNSARAALLQKTKKLELQQAASGLPAIFTLSGFWGGIHKFAKRGFWLNVIVVLLHTIHFFSQKIPERS